jgi:hypothetical protein
VCVFVCVCLCVCVCGCVWGGDFFYLEIFFYLRQKKNYYYSFKTNLREDKGHETKESTIDPS